MITWMSHFRPHGAEYYGESMWRGNALAHGAWEASQRVKDQNLNTSCMINPPMI